MWHQYIRNANTSTLHTIHYNRNRHTLLNSRTIHNQCASPSLECKLRIYLKAVETFSHLLPTEFGWATWTPCIYRYSTHGSYMTHHLRPIPACATSLHFHTRPCHTHATHHTSPYCHTENQHSLHIDFVVSVCVCSLYGYRYSKSAVGRNPNEIVTPTATPYPSIHFRYMLRPYL